ncbi:MAG TPA: extracellular solute-binding protein, partial [Spirochaetia bacterium]
MKGRRMSAGRLAGTLLLAATGLLLGAVVAQAGGGRESGGAVRLTVATVNNPDMFRMGKLSDEFTASTGIGLHFVIMPENELRQKVTEDVSLGSGKYDIVTIGNYDAPIWGKNRWLLSLEPFFAAMTTAEKDSYARDDLLPTIRSALSYGGEQYAIPIYGESSMMFYRKDLFAKAGLTMPERPTWRQIYDLAVKLDGIEEGVYGIVLRGMPGWGENLAP